MRTLVWYRGKDLRVFDHAPLALAAKQGEVVAVFVLEPKYFEPERVPAHAHRLQGLLHALDGLREDWKRS